MENSEPSVFLAVTDNNCEAQFSDFNVSSFDNFANHDQLNSVLLKLGSPEVGYIIVIKNGTESEDEMLHIMYEDDMMLDSGGVTSLV